MTEAAEQQMRFVFALRQKGVMDARVLEAMERIDRGLRLALGRRELGHCRQ